MTYNLTSLQNATNSLDIITWANTTTDGALIGVFLLGVFIIFTMVLLRKGYEFKSTLASVSFVMALVAILFGVAGLLSPNIVLAYIVTSATIAFVLYKLQD